MNVPALRFPEFNGEWVKTSLGQVGKVIRGASPRPKGDPRYYGGPVPRLMGQDVTRDGKFVTPIIDSLTVEGAKLSRPCPAGTLTIICSGNVGIPSILAVDACIHDGFLALIDIDENVDLEYLYSQLSRLRAKFDSAATHGGVFVNLTTDILREFPASFPSLPEQKKIAAFLGVVDAKISALRDRVAGLERYKRGLMQALFSQTLRFTKPDGTAFPDWEEKRLGDLCDALSGHPVSGDEIVENSNDTPLLRGINITEGTIRHSPEMDKFHGGDVDSLERFLVEEGDVVVAMDGSKVGKNVATISGSDAGSFLIQRVTRLRSDGRNDLRLVYQHITSHRFRNYVDTVNTSSGIPHISLKQIRDFPIATPHPEEQAKIAEALSAMDAKIGVVTSQLGRMQDFKKGLLQQMFV